MHLERDDPSNPIKIKNYTKGCLTLNAEEIRHSVMLTAEQVQPWRPNSLAELTAADFSAIVAAKPEVVLLGVGAQFAIPKPALLAQLYAHKIPVEIMDTASACRTFMLLVADKRDVCAALLIE